MEQIQSSERCRVKPLKLKGERNKSRKKKKKNSLSTSEELSVQLENIPGSGRIVSCGVTIHGFDTKFKEELQIGDRLIVFDSKTLIDESRIVVALLSQRSLTVDSPFPTDITSTTAFRISKESILLNAKVAKVLNTSGDEANVSAKELQDEVSRQLQKRLRKTRPVLKYRERTGMWGYRTVVETVPKNTTAEELLDMRAKRQGRDKYCH